MGLRTPGFLQNPYSYPSKPVSLGAGTGLGWMTMANYNRPHILPKRDWMFFERSKQNATLDFKIDQVVTWTGPGLLSFNFQPQCS